MQKQNETKLIGLYSSDAQSGKTTVARHLYHNYGFHQLSFATPVKQMLSVITDRLDELDSFELVYGNKKHHLVEGLSLTSRKLQQTLGTDWGREIVDPDLWVKYFLKTVESLETEATAYCESSPRIIVDDVRYPNEFQAIRDRGGILIKLVTKEETLVAPNAVKYEGLLDSFDFDHTLQNTASIAHLKQEADDLITKVVFNKSN